MYAGLIAEEGPVETLFHHPAHPYTRMLFAATPDLRGGERVTSIPGTPPRLDREITGCSFRPRCDVVLERCASERPELLEVTAGHRAACHHGELDAALGGWR